MSPAASTSRRATKAKAVNQEERASGVQESTVDPDTLPANRTDRRPQGNVEAVLRAHPELVHEIS